MAYHKPARIVQKNVYAWTDNLPAKSLSLQEPTRRHLPKVDCLNDFVGMPLKKHILGRYYFLLESTKSRKIDFQSYAKSLLCTYKELTCKELGAKLNFPLLAEKGAMHCLTRLIKHYEKKSGSTTFRRDHFCVALFGAALFGANILCFLLTLTQSPKPNPNPK